jgi:hypothetical protein
VNDPRRLCNSMEEETETKKEKRETAALTHKCSDSFAPAWYGSGRVWASIALRCWNPLEKENHWDCSQEPLYSVHISGPAFVYGFYPIAFKKHYNRNVENLNDPRSKQTANHLPSSSLAARTYEYNAHYITNSIVQYMLPPRANAQLRVYWTNNLEGPSQRHLDAPAILTWLSRYLMETTS